MEILHDNQDRRTILLALPKNEEAQGLSELLALDFNLVFPDDNCDLFEFFRKNASNLSAIIVDKENAQANDYEFLRAAAKDPFAKTVAVIIASLDEPNEEDMRCLDEGAADFVTKLHCRKLLTRRIQNAINLKSSTTINEVEAMLRQLPSNIFLKDLQGRYVFATHYWHHLDTGDDPNWSIRGKTDFEIRKDDDNARIAYESDMEVMRTGVGKDYVIEINVDGIQEFLKLIKRPVFDEDGNVSGVIVLANDVTETELLKRELEKRVRTDELTGLGNHRSFDEYLHGARNEDDFPLAVISADCDWLKRVNDTYGHLVGDEYIHLVATAFKSALPENALAFRTGGDEFVAFLPQTTEEEAAEAIRNMQAQCELFWLKDKNAGLSCGYSVANGPNDNLLNVVAAADRAMYANKTERKKGRTD